MGEEMTEDAGATAPRPVPHMREQLPLVSGMNDAMVTAAVLAGIAGSAAALHSAGLGALGITAAELLLVVGLAEIFCRRRRMRLTGIVLAVAGAGAALGITMTLLWRATQPGGASGLELATIERWATDAYWHMVAGFGAAAVAAILIHRRYRIAIAPALAWFAASAGVVGLVALAWPRWPLHNAKAVLLIIGLGAFALGVRKDRLDRGREGRLHREAFWLHIGAAWCIVHPLFAWLDASGAGSVGIIALYLGLAVVALAVDRRGLLVAGMLYFIVAMTDALEAVGVASAGWEYAAIGVSVLLLILGVGWNPIRQWCVDHAQVAWGKVQRARHEAKGAKDENETRGA